MAKLFQLLLDEVDVSIVACPGFHLVGELTGNFSCSALTQIGARFAVHLATRCTGFPTGSFPGDRAKQRSTIPTLIDARLTFLGTAGRAVRGFPPAIRWAAPNAFVLAMIVTSHGQLAAILPLLPLWPLQEDVVLTPCLAFGQCHGANHQC